MLTHMPSLQARMQGIPNPYLASNQSCLWIRSRILRMSEKRKENPFPLLCSLSLLLLYAGRRVTSRSCPRDHFRREKEGAPRSHRNANSRSPGRPTRSSNSNDVGSSARGGIPP